jgi:Holliday junction DNA helicase RuvA
MIARLSGLLDSVGEDWCIVDVNGVGYQVFCGTRTLRNLPPAGEAVRLSIVTQVREDDIRLFGFTADSEKQWFALLQTVQGVGAKVALAILSVLTPAELADAIAAGDKTSVSRANGVGGKLAQRICAELKDKAAALPSSGGVTTASAAAPAAKGSATEDAISALVNLGYRHADAHGAVIKAARALGEGAEVAALIRSGLKELAR